MTLTEGELIQAIQLAIREADEGMPDGPLGVTAPEAAEYLRESPYRISKALRDAVRHGRLVVEKGYRRNILGDMYRPPVYRPRGNE